MKRWLAALLCAALLTSAAACLAQGEPEFRHVDAIGPIGLDLPASMVDFVSDDGLIFIAVQADEALAQGGFLVDTLLAYASMDVPTPSWIKENLHAYGGLFASTLSDQLRALQPLLAQPIYYSGFEGGFQFDVTCGVFAVGRDAPAENVPEAMRGGIEVAQMDYLLYVGDDPQGGVSMRVWVLSYVEDDGAGEYMFLLATSDMDRTIDDPAVRRMLLSLGGAAALPGAGADTASAAMPLATPLPTPQPTPLATPQPTPLPVAGEAEGQTVRITRGCNLRAQSNADSELVGKALKGETYPLVGIAENGWFLIRLPDGREAYLSPKMAEIRQ